MQSTKAREASRVEVQEVGEKGPEELAHKFEGLVEPSTRVTKEFVGARDQKKLCVRTNSACWPCISLCECQTKQNITGSGIVWLRSGLDYHGPQQAVRFIHTGGLNRPSGMICHGSHQ